MKTVAIVNERDGVGKTTTAVSLSCTLGQRGKHILLVDLDPNAGASSWADCEDKDLIGCIHAMYPLEVLISHDVFPGVDVIGGGESSMQAEAMPNLPDLIGGIAELADYYDYTILDLGAGFGNLMLAALKAADDVLIPITVFDSDPNEVVDFLNKVNSMKVTLNNPDLRVMGLALTRFRHQKKYLPQIHSIFDTLPPGLPVRIPIHESPRFRQARNSHQSIQDYAPNSQEVADFTAFTQEFLRRA